MTIGLLVVALIAVSGMGVTLAGTLARFSDTEAGGASNAAAATVVLGGRGTPTALSFTGLGSTARTVNLSVVYRGTIPATIQFQLPSGATATNCVRSGSTYVDPLLYRTLTIKLGDQAAIPYCSLLDGVARTLITTVQPNTTTVVPITVTAGGLLTLIGRTENAAIAIRAVGGFTDFVSGTIAITASGLLGANPTTVPAPTGVTALAARSARTAPTTVAAVGTPAECAALGPFTETVLLTPDRPRFVAAEDRPGVAGPFLVVGTSGDDTIVGSAAADCLSGGAGADTVDGLGGADVLLGADGADLLTGSGGDDLLYGADGADKLTGGPGVDLLDGGVDGAECDLAPEDRPESRCTPPATAVPTTTAVAPTTTAQVPTTAPPPVPTTTAPAPAPATEVPVVTTTPPEVPTTTETPP